MTDERAADSLRAAMADLVANFEAPVGITSILETVTALAVELIEAVDVADVLLIDGDRYRSLAPTAELAAQLDAVQLDSGQGPCLDAASNELTVLCADLTAEPRWAAFAAAAVQAGIHSVMSFQLYSQPVSREGVAARGALNLFSHNVVHFSVEDQAIAAMLATHAATALIAADRNAQFESALASRDLIGQAKGILMERFKVDAVHAFGLLTKLSQETNTRLRIIAQRIVETT